MRGVSFDDKHSYYDWGLLLKSRPLVSAPPVQEKIVQIPGTNTTLDLTESLYGGVKYEQREIKVEFYLTGRSDTWQSIYSILMAYLHGQKRTIVLDDDKDFYYTGRLTVGDLEADRGVASVEITAKVDPMKRERYGSGVRL